MNETVEQLQEKRDLVMGEIKDWYLERLRNGRCEVNFTKKDGTERTMLCTLNMDLIPSEHHPKSDGNKTAQTNESVRVYDLEKEAWRSFILDSVNVFDPTL